MTYGIYLNLAHHGVPVCLILVDSYYIFAKLSQGLSVGAVLRLRHKSTWKARFRQKPVNDSRLIS